VIVLRGLLRQLIRLLAAVQATGRRLTSGARSMRSSLEAQAWVQLQSALKQQQQQQHLNTCQVAAAAAAADCLQACPKLQAATAVEAAAAVTEVAGRQNFI
jgi:hypothetical protein